MEEDSSLGIVLPFKLLAEKHFDQGEVADAFKCYLICLRLYPEWKQDLKEKFVLVLCAYGELLEHNHEIDQLFTCYEDALEVYYDSSEILCNLGAHLCRLGFHLKGYHYFLEALRQNEKYIPAHRNIQNASNYIVERWHFRMLNDSYRNEAFREAIFKKIQQKFNTVLDIGVGTGLLSLYAVHSNAVQIYGCDYNKNMIAMANEVLEKNLFKENIVLINKLSTDLKIPTDIPRRVSLVVTETMDSGFLGENLLKTLSHAWDELLLPPYPSTTGVIKNDGQYGIVIPFGGSLFIAGIECRSFAKKYYHPLTDSLTDDCMDALQYMSLNNGAKSTVFNSIPSTTIINLRAEMLEPYDTDHLRKANYKFLTEAYELFHINFNDPVDINDHIRGENAKRVLDITCTVSGYLYAIAAWFKVRIDEDIILSTSVSDANAENCCWDQAMFPLCQPIQVIPGCVVTIAANWENGKVLLDVINCTFPSNNAKLTQIANSDSMLVPHSIISMLNDTSLVHCFSNMAANFIKNFDVHKCTLYILDLFPLPIFGLNLLYNCHLINSAKCDIKLACIPESDSVKQYITLYASTNSIQLENIQFLTSEDFDRLCTIGKPVFDVILSNLVERNGDLSDSAIIQTSIFRDISNAQAVFYPYGIRICCQLIQSTWLEKASRVIDKDVGRLHISSVINRFKVSHYLDLNLFSLDHKPLCDIFKCASIASDQLNEQMENVVTVPVTNKGSITAISYWFNIFFTQQLEYSTYHDHAYVPQAAFVLDQSIDVSDGDIVNVNFLYQRGMFRLTVENPSMMSN